MSPADPPAAAGSVDEPAAQEERLVLDAFGNDEAREGVPPSRRGPHLRAARPA
ncbi:hypothetical protein [Streptomyces sp. NPDC048516]|uniref:hypothetical protein n=1 Tax=Streptomyces sp. NPDC048516 TaxID=3365565 RepID=UPI00371BF044